jgi:hypothetical protein
LKKSSFARDFMPLARPYRAIGGALALAIVFIALPAGAQEATQENLGRAQVLFDQAAAHFTEGKLEEACAEYKASYELGHKTTAILNVGICEEKRGRFATAWSAYREASTVAVRAGKDALANDAGERASRLDPKLAKIRIVLAYRLAGLQIKLDGQVIPTAALATALPIDSGRHVLEASAEGYESWQESVTASDGVPTEIKLPELKAKPGARVAPIVAINPVVTTSPVRVAGYIGLGVGGTVAAVGGLLGLVARGNYNDAADICRLQATGCSPEQASDVNRTRGTANVGTGFVIAGGVIVVAATVMAIFGGNTITKSKMASNGALFTF